MSLPEQTDVLVIGSGLAGCVAALAAAREGARVIMITRQEDANRTNTSYAQGGIIYQARKGDPDSLIADMLEAGVGLSYRPACELLAREGPALVESVLLGEFGAPFDRDAAGRLDLTREGGHNANRIVHIQDLTGKSVQECALRRIQQEENITLCKGATAVDLLTLSHHSLNPLDAYEPPTCVGAYVLERGSGAVEPIFARETILATGGLGQLFLHTTNPRGARGDGIAMAYRAGARLLNLEFVQFHPTTLYHPESEGFLISEAVRGEGGILRRRNGEPFMDKIHDMGSLAPRDVVSRAIHDILLNSDEPCVYLDLTHKDAGWIVSRFPHIHGRCLEMGIDITKQPIPVVPAAHYSCGGVAVDLDGRSSILGLRAAGEVSCTGIHGANRLASTSLLEALVWGWRSGQGAARALGEPARPFPAIEPWKSETEDSDPALILQDWLSIKHTMWNYVGLARSRRRMRRAHRSLRELQMEIEDFYDRARLTDDIVGLRNGVQTALAILYAASENRHSRGCHYLVEE